MLLAVLGFLVYECGVAQTPASFQATAGELRAEGTFYYLPFKLENVGRRSAKQIQIKVTAEATNEEPLESDVTMDWLPGNSTRDATAVFSEDPRGRPVEIQVLGFEDP